MSKHKNQDQESANATTPAAHKAGSAPRQKERNNFIVMPSSLAFHNACNDMSNMHRKLRGRLATAHKKLSTIYMIAHAEVPSHSCHHVHDDWRKLKDQILKEANQ